MSARAQPSSGAPARIGGALEFRLLGPLELRRGGEALRLGGARQRALLALLCLERGAVVSVDRIVDELWGESPPASARHMVEVYVSKLRKLLGRDLLVTRAPGYLLALDPESLDIERFEGLFAEGSEALAAGDHDLAAARLGEALGLWRGEALADFAYEPFAQAEIARLTDLRLLAEEQRVEAELTLARAGELVPEIEALVAAQPLRERRHGLLMLALYRAGRQADALAAYRRARETLVEELGIDPGQELRDLERAILEQDEAALAAEASVEPEAASSTQMKFVTVLVAELGGAHTGFDSERFSREVDRRAGVACETLSLHGAMTAQLPGAMVLAVFGHPVSHEDDALRAIRAATRLQTDSLGGIGICSGECLIEGASIGGPLVGSARRLAEQATRSDVIIDEQTRSLLAQGVSLEPLKSEESWRLVEVREGASLKRLRLDAPLIGRDRELQVLEKLFAQTVSEDHARLVALISEPGIGKSRLAYEFTQRMGTQVRLLVGRCVSFGDGLTYYPLREMLLQLGAVDHSTLRTVVPQGADADGVSDRLASILVAGETTSPREEIQWAAQRLLASLARERPLLLLLEDIHWAEQTFLELIAHSVQATHGPMMVVCAARPELVDSWSDWRGATAFSSTLALEPLDDRESQDLLSALGTGRRLNTRERMTVLATAEGNPFFLEQLSALLSDRGDSMGRASIPPSVQTLLSARLDQLGPGEIELLQRGAIVGREFSATLVRDLLPAGARRTLGRHLQRLVRGRFVVTDDFSLPFAQVFRFRHALLREAVYRRIPKETRAELHERAADLLLGLGGLAPPEQGEVVGYHLEQAYRCRVELGLGGDDLVALGRRAATALLKAGRRARDRLDYAAAVKLLSRARDVLEEDDRLRLSLLPDLGECLFWLGEFADANAVLEDAIGRAREAGDRATEWAAVLAQLRLAGQFGPVDKLLSNKQLEERGRQALAAFQELRDLRGEAKAWLFVGTTLTWQFHYQEGVHAFEEARAMARLAGDDHLEAVCVGNLATAMVDGPTPSGEGVERLEELLAAASGRFAFLERWLLCDLSRLHAKRGESKEAGQLAARVRTLTEAAGSEVELATMAAFHLASVKRDAGDLEGAEAELRHGFDVLERLGEQGWSSTIAVRLADVLLAQDKVDEAVRFLAITEERAVSDDLASLGPLLSLRAEVLARQERFEEAEMLAYEASNLLEGTDDLEARAEAFLSLGKVLLLAGKANEAGSAFGDAVRLFEQKGFTVRASEARGLLGDF